MDSSAPKNLWPAAQNLYFRLSLSLISCNIGTIGTGEKKNTTITLMVRRRNIRRQNHQLTNAMVLRKLYKNQNSKASQIWTISKESKESGVKQSQTKKPMIPTKSQQRVLVRFRFFETWPKAFKQSGNDG